jgi:hypothetical protein
MISLLTPIRSDADHAKTSKFLSRKTNSSASSSGAISVPRQTTLSSTMGPRGIFLVSPSASLACLDPTRAV